MTGICLTRYIKGVESVFAIVAEPNRRAILGLLAASEQTVGDLERQLRMVAKTGRVGFESAVPHRRGEV